MGAHASLFAKAEEPEILAVSGDVPDPVSADDVEAVKQELIQEYVQKMLGEIVTAPYDPRFPNTNQSRHCFVRYNEYYKCAFERGEDHPRCQFYKRCYESLCPADWLEQWQELRDQGLWVGKY